jgi:putative oxidoreductase
MLDSANFVLTDEMNLLRMLVSLFFIPHLVGKFTTKDKVNGFFIAAGMNPPDRYRWFSFVVEIIVVILLFLAIYPAYAAAVGAIHLFVAGYASWKVSKGGWIWLGGGAEYPIFWALALCIVAMYYWP